MAHYYYFPFKPDSGDAAKELTQNVVLEKYKEGRATVSRNREHWEGTVGLNGGPGDILYKGEINPLTRPNKHYPTQNTVVIECTTYKYKEGGMIRNGQGNIIDTPETIKWELGRNNTPLNNVKENDVLIVDGHGNQSSTMLCNKERSFEQGAVSLRPNELACILLRQGLNDGVIVKLTMCYGGGTHGSDPDGSEDGIYAKKLAMLIASFKPNVVVGGYAGKFVVGHAKAGGLNGSNYHPYNAVVEDNNGRLDLAKVNLRYYNGVGQLVNRPHKPLRVRGVNLEAR